CTGIDLQSPPTTYHSPPTTHHSPNMIHSWFAIPWSFYLLAILPVWAVLVFPAARQRRKTLMRFGTLPAVRALASMRGGLRIFRQLCLLAGVLLLVAGIAGPRWGWDWEQAA